MPASPHIETGPGATTIPDQTPEEERPDISFPPNLIPPTSRPGPIIDNTPTTLTTYTTTNLPTSSSPLIHSLYTLVNKAFSLSHSSQNVLPSSLPRLPTSEDYITQIGTDAETQIYILTYTGTENVVAHAASMPYKGKEGMFSRARLPERILEGKAKVWELRMLATDVEVQGQGVAGWLLGLVEDGAKQKGKGKGKGEGEVWMVITTIKELNGGWYARRGYEFDYETWVEKGTLGSETGFTVVHMSKKISV